MKDSGVEEEDEEEFCAVGEVDMSGVIAEAALGMIMIDDPYEDDIEFELRTRA